MVKNKWVLNPLSKSQVEIQNTLSKSLNIQFFLVEILIKRGIDSFDKAKEFFRPNLKDHLHNPMEMKDMNLAVNRIIKAISEKQNILVYGDYDVDGTTSVAMMYSFLNQFLENITYYIPDRYKEGYGISVQSIDFASDNNFDLIIALDCGIKSINEIDYANSLNIDYIICDHHQPDLEIPDAIAVLNPKRPDCKYPFKQLSGCGVGFKLIQALALELNFSEEKVFELLDYVAISIAADIVSMTGENRVLANYGLKYLNENKRPCFAPFFISKDNLNVMDLVFGIAPRINAAGRIDHGNKAVDLLIETNPNEVTECFDLINEFNQERKDLQLSIYNESTQILGENYTKNSIVVYAPHWHKGVIGIVASKLVEKYYKPTLVLTKSGEKLAGSGRSVEGFNLYDSLLDCQKSLIQFGGHKAAVGLTMKEENIDFLSDLFEKSVSEKITKDQKYPTIKIDAEISFNQITEKSLGIIDQMSPFGPENMNPTFITKGVRDMGYAKSIGKDNEHLKMRLYQNDKKYPVDTVGFGLGKYANEITKDSLLDIVYHIEWNEWNGKKNIQLRILDLKVH